MYLLSKVFCSKNEKLTLQVRNITIPNVRDANTAFTFDVCHTRSILLEKYSRVFISFFKIISS